MYHRVTIKSVSVEEALQYKRELIAAGLVMDQDFVWEWQTPQYEDWTFIAPAMVHFDIVDAAQATFYRLKWTRDN